MHNQIRLFLLTHKKGTSYSITDKSAEADFFVAFSQQYKLSTPKTCISQKNCITLRPI